MCLVAACGLASCGWGLEERLYRLCSWRPEWRDEVRAPGRQDELGAAGGGGGKEEGGVGRMSEGKRRVAEPTGYLV